MKPQEVREMTDEELARSIEDNRQELFHLRMQNQTAQLEDSSRIRSVRRDIARLLTEQTARNKDQQTGI